VQNELARVLYPVFIHCFLDLVEASETELSREFFATFRGDHESLHSAELSSLQGLSSPEHLASNQQVRFLPPSTRIRD
jgi:transcription initiation factor TFIID subunit 5